MKFNWGTGVTLFFICFAASMTFAVVSTTKHPPQLVQKDYYALDLNYQDHLERKQQTAALTTPPDVRFDAPSRNIRVSLPAGMTALHGQAKCYRSSTTRDDFSVNMDHVAALDIPTAGFVPGRWHVELEWETTDAKKYFWETALVVQ